MSDLINRQDLRLMTVEEGIGHTIEYAKGWKACIEWIQSLPSAQQWIPCSERLPEEGKMVLTTIRGTDIIRIEKGETLEDAIERSMTGHERVTVSFIGEDGWYGCDGYPEIVAPTAWMPLPEPWKEEQE